ncbi:MAG TPA: EamA family transporter RarD [Caldimonas sp.]|jgi:chloramphenicol-sensitive protein RarD|nr:EamA family transporter RarD [Caldimonas sp.]HEX2541953.1 EamA family transporter RarD [Caldimonas sp.]
MNVGAAAAAVAFSLWGFFPLYFRLMPEVPPLEVLANRIVWSLVLVAVALTLRRNWSWLGGVARQPRVLAAFVFTALLLSANWLTYIWAVSNGHVVDASLGYFITPLVNVLLGYSILGERPRHAQWVALAFASAGVLWLAIGAGSFPWIGLVIGLSFGAYGLLRKIAVIGALEGLTLETLLLAPAAAVAMAWWWGGSATSFPAPDLATNAWLVGLGPATTVPLLLFAVAARRLRLTTLGLFQYLSPTIQFVLGVWLFAEPLTAARLAGFAVIWAALALYTIDSWRVASRIGAQPAPAVR